MHSSSPDHPAPHPDTAATAPPARPSDQQLVNTLFDLGRQVTSVLDLDELLQRIPQLISRLTEFTAFAVYLMSWLGIIVAFGVTTALLAGLFSAREMAGVLVLPSVLIFSTVFYVSLLFTFNDSFGGSSLGPQAAP